MTIDAAVLAELKALDDSGANGLLAELIGLFETGTPERLARMREAGAANDSMAVSREAHALKGSCGALGAPVLLGMASELEQRSKAGDISKLEEKLQAIEAEYKITLAELRAEQTKK